MRWIGLHYQDQLPLSSTALPSIDECATMDRISYPRETVNFVSLSIKWARTAAYSWPSIWSSAQKTGLPLGTSSVSPDQHSDFKEVYTPDKAANSLKLFASTASKSFLLFHVVIGLVSVSFSRSDSQERSTASRYLLYRFSWASSRNALNSWRRIRATLKDAPCERINSLLEARN